MKRLFVAMAAVAALSASTDARACSPPSCEEGELFPSAGSVPANFPGVLWMAGMKEGKREGASGLRQLGAALFSEADGELSISLEAIEDRDHASLIRPDAAWQAGQRYQVVVEDSCSQGETRMCVTSSLTVTPPRPRPRRLGVLTKRPAVRGPLEVTTWSGSCSDKADTVYVDVKLELATEAKPWADALVFVTLVDGEPWFPTSGLGVGHAYGESWVGRGRDRLYASCEPKEHDDKDRGLEPGPHEVRIHAQLVDEANWLQSEGLKVELSCSTDPGAPAESPTPTASTVRACAELGPHVPRSGSPSSCLCRAAAVPPTSPLLSALFVLAAVAAPLRRATRVVAASGHTVCGLRRRNRHRG